jgi:hypothetical protein
MRGLRSVATGQRLLEGIEVAQAIHRGHVGAARSSPPARHVASHRARNDAPVFRDLAATVSLTA